MAEAVEEKTVVAVATALANAHASGTGCSGSVQGCARSGESQACCELAVESTASSEDGSAYAEAGAHAPTLEYKRCTHAANETCVICARELRAQSRYC